MVDFQQSKTPISLSMTEGIEHVVRRLRQNESTARPKGTHGTSTKEKLVAAFALFHAQLSITLRLATILKRVRTPVVIGFEHWDLFAAVFVMRGHAGGNGLL